MPGALTFTQLQWPTATLGPDASVPMLAPPVELDFEPLDADARMQAGFRRGMVPTGLPFARQSGYDRTLVTARHEVAVLEGERLRATFLLGLGGRLWSLVDRHTGRELLYRNPAIQFANLAIRDAWFAGGVEWNVGLIGHTPLSCSPLHAARVDGPDGPVLRMWEFDRLRECVYRIDAWLDRETGVLCVRPEIRNPNPHPVDTYWWSNMAVPQSEGVRVVVPAESAWKFGFTRVMHRVPVGDGTDVSWPARAIDSVDYFFDLREAERPWIAAVGPDGRGIVQTSSAALEGRKLFVWGRGSGGTTWQRWLSPLGGEYLEIQAGLARTQMEHLELEAGASVSWMETYAPLKVDASAAASSWANAQTCVAAAIAANQPDAWFASVTNAAGQLAQLEVPGLAHAGSGWGALERLRRAASGDASLDLSATPFADDTLGPAQQQWVTLLRTGAFPASDPLVSPASYQVAPGWTPLLQADGSWRGLLHLGEIQWHAGAAEAAREAWTASLAAAPNPWAWRNLGVAALAAGDTAGAADAYAQACALLPDDLDLALERLAIPGQDVLNVVATLPDGIRRAPRVRLAEASAALGAGQIERALAVLTPLPEIPTLREGELTLGELWSQVQDALPAAPDTPLVASWRARGPQLPMEWDFRMVSAPGSTKEDS